MIEIKDFSKRYKDKIVIDKSSICIQENSINFLLGKNGCGKTTLIKCLCQLEKYNGQILFGNMDFRHVRNDCMVLWDDTPFYKELSGIENLCIFSNHKISKKKIYNLVKAYIYENLLKKKVKTYSYGQKKRLGLALVELLECKYIILDEVTNGLDYDLMSYLKKRIMEWKVDKTIILTGHHLEFYDTIVDSLYVFKNNIIYQYNGFEKGKSKLEDVYNAETTS